MSERLSKRVIVIPAGRRRYMRPLLAHLERQKDAFDELRIWANTVVASDLDYFAEVADRLPWVRVVPPTEPIRGCDSIFQFFRGCAEPGTTYLRLDDDVVWLEDGFVAKMFDFRESDAARPYPLVYGNIVNNAVLSHLHQRAGNVGYEHGTVANDYADAVGWVSGEFAALLHATFLQSVRKGSGFLAKWKAAIGKADETTHVHVFDTYARVSINCIAWLGDEFAEFGGVVDRYEEIFLSVDLPKRLGRPNAIYGDALCAHYAFFVQRIHMDKTGLLADYYELAGLPRKDADAEQSLVRPPDKPPVVPRAPPVSVRQNPLRMLSMTRAQMPSKNTFVPAPIVQKYAFNYSAW